MALRQAADRHESNCSGVEAGSGVGPGGELLKERVLKRLTLPQAIDLLASRRWNFFEVRQNDRIVRLEAPVGTGEAYIVELPYRSTEDLKQIVDAMQQHGFLEQEVRIVPE
jgi:hypothetical protein